MRVHCVHGFDYINRRAYNTVGPFVDGNSYACIYNIHTHTHTIIYLNNMVCIMCKSLSRTDATRVWTENRKFPACVTYVYI